VSTPDDLEARVRAALRNEARKALAAAQERADTLKAKLTARIDAHDHDGKALIRVTAERDRLAATLGLIEDAYRRARDTGMVGLLYQRLSEIVARVRQEGQSGG
jgi:hypothetical protein